MNGTKASNRTKTAKREPMTIQPQTILDTIRHELETQGRDSQDLPSGVLLLSAAASLRQAVDLLYAAQEAKLKETING